MDRRRLLAAMGTLAAAGLSGPPGAAAEDDLAAAAGRAWLFCLPLIEMAAARARMLGGGGAGFRAGLNRFAHAAALAGPGDRLITTPNNDTLYSSAFLDLTQGPARLDIPKAGPRYLSVAVMDMYTGNDVVLGARTPGGAAGTWRLLPPGAAPDGPRDLVLETPHAWVLARTLVDGPADLAAARRIQEALSLEGPPPGPGGMRYAVRSDPPAAVFASAAALMRSDPPVHKKGLEDFERVRAAARGGVFDADAFAPEVLVRVAAGVARARALIEAAGGQLRFDGGWSYPRPSLGVYGDDFIYRAAVAVAGLGALPVREAMYLRAQGNAGDHRFTGDGEHRLVLKGPLPVDGFWSLTMYEISPDGQFYLTPNPIGRYAIGDRTPGLTRSSDGALEIVIARKDPGGRRTANWLPAPASGDFAMTLRCYLPRSELLSGAYKVPAVVPA